MAEYLNSYGRWNDWAATDDNATGGIARKSGYLSQFSQNYKPIDTLQMAKSFNESRTEYPVLNMLDGEISRLPWTQEAMKYNPQVKPIMPASPTLFEPTTKPDTKTETKQKPAQDTDIVTDKMLSGTDTTKPNDFDGILL